MVFMFVNQSSSVHQQILVPWFVKQSHIQNLQPSIAFLGLKTIACSVIGKPFGQILIHASSESLCMHIHFPLKYSAVLVSDQIPEML